MSFIDLQGAVVWSEADITARTEAMVHAEFSVQEETILNRKVTGTVLGQWQMTPQEQGDLMRYAAVCLQAKQAGVDARADNARLRQALAVEAALRQLAGADDPILTRDQAQAVVDAAPADVQALVAARRDARPDES